MRTADAVRRTIATVVASPIETFRLTCDEVKGFHGTSITYRWLPVAYPSRPERRDICMAINCLPSIGLLSELTRGLTCSSIILGMNFVPTRIKESQPEAIDEQNQHFLT